MKARLLDDATTLRRHLRTRWRELDGDALPAAVAELDVELAPFVRAALVDAVERSDLGYPPDDDRTGVGTVFARWAERRWGLDVDPDCVTLVPDIVRGIEACLLAFTEPGDGVVIQTPIYPPFLTVVSATGRRIVENPVDASGRVDVSGLAARCRDERPRVLLLCNPHNPTGSVFTADELDAIAAVADEHDLLVVSDEVHADLVYAPAVHCAMARHAPHRTITLQSPSKAFNVAGLRVAVAAAGSSELHARLLSRPSIDRDGVGILGVVALLAAWTDDGEAWLDSLVPQLAANRDRVLAALERTVLRVLPPQATYLAWIDCTALGDVEPHHRFAEAGVVVSNGTRFGPPGRGHVRLNFGCGPRTLDAVLHRMVAASRSR